MSASLCYIRKTLWRVTGAIRGYRPTHTCVWDLMVAVEQTESEEFVGSNWELLAAGDTGVCGISVTYSGEEPYYALLFTPITKLTR